MSGFTRRARGLDITFPQSGLQSHEPGDVGDYVQLVHPIFGPLTRVGASERVFSTVTEAVGQQIAVMTTAPADRVRCVEYAHALHDDATVRHVRFRVQERNGGTLTYVQSTVNQGSGAGIAANLHVPLMRPIFLGPSEVFWVQIDVAGAFAITWAVAVTDYSPADVPLL
jgi:hypothetical protein